MYRAIVSTVIATASLALKELEGNMAVISVFVLVFRIIASKRYFLEMNRLILVTSVFTLVCTESL